MRTQPIRAHRNRLVHVLSLRHNKLLTEWLKKQRAVALSTICPLALMCLVQRQQQSRCRFQHHRAIAMKCLLSEFHPQAPPFPPRHSRVVQLERAVRCRMRRLHRRFWYSETRQLPLLLFLSPWPRRHRRRMHRQMAVSRLIDMT